LSVFKNYLEKKTSSARVDLPVDFGPIRTGQLNVNAVALQEHVFSEEFQMRRRIVTNNDERRRRFAFN
jgi:hypothetical protein